VIAINMALSPKDMDGFLPLLATADTKTKLTLAMNLINYLGDPDNSIECSDIGQFIDGLVPWMQSSNNKVCGFSHSFVCMYV
jgi:CLIP-associating protein 1/2